MLLIWCQPPTGAIYYLPIIPIILPKLTHKQTNKIILFIFSIVFTKDICIHKGPDKSTQKILCILSYFFLQIRHLSIYHHQSLCKCRSLSFGLLLFCPLDQTKNHGPAKTLCELVSLSCQKKICYDDFGDPRTHSISFHFFVSIFRYMGFPTRVLPFSFVCSLYAYVCHMPYQA